MALVWARYYPQYDSTSERFLCSSSLMILTIYPLPTQQPWMILLRHSTMHSSTMFSVTRTDSYYPATTLRQLLTNRLKSYLITTWYFLLSTSILDENASRCAATTVIATLSTNQGRWTPLLGLQGPQTTQSLLQRMSHHCRLRYSNEGVCRAYRYATAHN